jgi:TonB-linked SusC/RagA family outer membrane protein
VRNKVLFGFMQALQITNFKPKIMMMKKLYRKLSLAALVLLLCSSVMMAQDRTVSGTVTDENGQALPGVNVLVKGTSQGTVSDSNGKYSLAGVSDNATLVFSFIGYVAQEVPVAGKTVIDAGMTPDITSLEEVVVVGYGEQKKSLVTGSISQVKAEEIATVSVNSVDQALAGRSAGVAVVGSSGSPGSIGKIRIRGVGSNGDADPLFIIDGVRTSINGTDFLSPNDIASIEVLKDAASTSIYGTAGANGVVIITTKKGKSGVAEISYSGQMGTTSLRENGLKLMNEDQYRQYMQESGNLPGPWLDPATNTNVTNNPATGLPWTWSDHPEVLAQVGTNTNWLDETFSTAPFMNHNISATGGTEKSSFFVSTGYWNQQGIAGGDKSQYSRYTARINSNHKLKDWLNVGENFQYMHSKRQNFNENSEFGGVVGSALSLDPLTAVRYTDGLPQHMDVYIDANRPLVKDGNGNYYGLSRWVTGEFGNPLMTYDLQHQNAVTNKIFGNVYAEIKPIKDLTFTTRYGIDAAFQRQHQWNPTYFYSIERQNTGATGQDTWDEWFTTQWENFATYDKQFGDHHITATAGTSLIQYQHNVIGTQYSGLFRQTDQWSYASSASRDGDIASGNQDGNNLVSYFGRASYDYKDKYMFTATVRRDGSSLFADGHQWGVFPSVSLGWVASNEDFFAPVSDYMSFFKLRGYWGQNGSNANVTAGQWMNYVSTTVTVNGQKRPIRYADAAGAYLVGAAPEFAENPKLTWETSEQIGFGADMRFLSDKLTLSVDWFKKTTEDLLTNGRSPSPAGLSMARVNAGTVENKGIEIELGYSGETSPDGLHYTLSANFTSIKNKVTALNDQIGTEPAGASVGTHWNNATRFKVGEPIWYFQGYKTDGIFQSAEEITAYLSETGITGYAPQPGDPRIIDTNGDKAISAADWVKIGSPHPTFYYGFRINLEYKGFDLLLFGQGQGGNDIMMGFFRTDRGTANKPAFFFEDRWTAEHHTDSWFRASTTGLAYNSDYMVTKGDFMRIRQLQLGYTLPKSVTETLRIKNLRVYGSLDNYFTFTKYKGMDPEVGSVGNNSFYIDKGVYPVPRKVLFGVNLTL